MKKKTDAYQIVTDQIVAALDKNIVPWRKPWAGGEAGLPANFERKNSPYKGINSILTMLSAILQGFECPYWVTFKGARRLGGSVNKGQKGTKITAWRIIEKDKVDEDGNKVLDDNGAVVKTKRFFCVTHTVFNLEQTSLDWDAPVATGEAKTPSSVFTEYVEREKIPVGYGGGRAFYSPQEDRIQLPKTENFEDEAEFHGTAFHEAVHSTGHKSRLDRFDKEDQAEAASGESYSKEELVAEIGAAMLCNLTEVDTDKAFQNSVAYIQTWKDRIKADPKLIVNAASQAQKAADLILGDA